MGNYLKLWKCVFHPHPSKYVIEDIWITAMLFRYRNAEFHKSFNYNDFSEKIFSSFIHPHSALWLSSSRKITQQLSVIHNHVLGWNKTHYMLSFGSGNSCTICMYQFWIIYLFQQKVFFIYSILTNKKVLLHGLWITVYIYLCSVPNIKSWNVFPWLCLQRRMRQWLFVNTLTFTMMLNFGKQRVNKIISRFTCNKRLKGQE